MPYIEDGITFYRYGEDGAPAGAGKGAQVLEEILKSTRETGHGKRVPVTWLRPTEISQMMFGTPPIFSGPYDQFAVNQGVVGNCWFLAVLADVALVPECINTLVPPDNQILGFESGVFHFRFFCRGEWIDVCVDDYLPCVVKADMSVVTLFCKPTETGGFWAPLLEKAYAKTYGSYGDINLGMPRIAMVEFTGGLTQTFAGDDPDIKQVLLAAKQSHSLMSITTKTTAPAEFLVPRDKSLGPGNEPVTSTGIVLGHCYSILDVQQVYDLKNLGVSYLLLKVRNPWGNATEWNGDFSDKDPNKKWEDTGIDLRLEKRADGEFWITCEDMCTYTAILDICRYGMKYRGVGSKKYGGLSLDVRRGVFDPKNSGPVLRTGEFVGKSGFYAYLKPTNKNKGKMEGGLQYNSLCLVSMSYLNYKKSGIDESIPTFGFYVIWYPGHNPPSEVFLTFPTGSETCLTAQRRETNFVNDLPEGTVVIVPWTKDPMVDPSKSPYLLRILVEGEVFEFDGKNTVSADDNSLPEETKLLSDLRIQTL